MDINILFEKSSSHDSNELTSNDTHTINKQINGVKKVFGFVGCGMETAHFIFGYPILTEKDEKFKFH